VTGEEKKRNPSAAFFRLRTGEYQNAISSKPLKKFFEVDIPALPRKIRTKVKGDGSPFVDPRSSDRRDWSEHGVVESLASWTYSRCFRNV
jgi:hypothetical protein